MLSVRVLSSSGEGSMSPHNFLQRSGTQTSPAFPHPPRWQLKVPGKQRTKLSLLEKLQAAPWPLITSLEPAANLPASYSLALEETLSSASLHVQRVS